MARFTTLDSSGRRNLRRPGPSRRQGAVARRDTGRRRALLLCGLGLPFLIGVYVLILTYWARPVSPGRELRLDQFLSLVSDGRVSSATILAEDNRIIGEADAQPYWVDFAPGHETLFARLTGALDDAGVPTTVERQPLKKLVQPAGVLIPALIVVDGVFILLLLARGVGDFAGFGKAGARRADGERPVRFADLAGVDEAVEELGEISQFLAHPERFAAMGAAVPKGVLLDGPPGCGKTRLARALAGESEVPFYTISGSDFVEMFVGVGAARIRDLFATAKANAPAIVFIDEMDAVGRARTSSPTGGQDERESALNQLLVEMDGFDVRSGVVVLGATNRPDVLDPALLRPGRFDRRITIDPPDLRGREGVLRIHTRGKPLAADVDLGAVARRTAGFSGAELANVVNEAAVLATRAGSETIQANHFSEAVERVVAGPQRASRVLSTEDRRRVAVHEAGHAVCSAAVAEGDAVSKVSIVARGHGGGFTWYQPGNDRVLATKSQLLDRVVALLGGRAAEELLLGEPSTGANDDLRRATALARRVVWECGMGDGLGPMAIAELPAAAAGDGAPPWSESIVAELDWEVQATVSQALHRARSLLLGNRTLLEEMADRLVADESLEGSALEELLARVQPADPPRRAPTRPAPVRPPVRSEVGGAGVAVLRPTFVPEQLASFRDIGNWLSPGPAQAATPIDWTP